MVIPGTTERKGEKKKGPKRKMHVTISDKILKAVSIFTIMLILSN